VLVGESTHRAALHAIAFEAAGTPELKGKREPIRTWRALRVIAERRGLGRVEGLDPPFVGRQSELQLLKDLLAGVGRDRRARMVSIVGEVGIGKSRLVWELQKYADGLAEPISWNQGRSPAFGTEGIASWALSDMLRGHIGVVEGDEDDTVAAALSASLDQIVEDDAERARLRQWLGALLCCGPAPDGDRSEFDAAIRSYFAAMAGQRTAVLAFEDLQWADAGLVDLVEQLTDWMPSSPVLVLALTRPELLERRPGWSSGRRGVVTVRLGPLAEAEMGQLLEEMMGTLEPGLRAHIIERAAGVPLFAVELARWLIGQDLITSVHGRGAALIETGKVALPETLQSLIGARIDRLEPPDRSLLQDAAILGSTFMLPGLAAISGNGEANLAERLELFVKQELIEPIHDPRSPMRGGFRFVQELVRQVARNRMSREVRRARHVAAARYVESRGGPDDPVVAADHYLSALSVTSAGVEADMIRDQAAGALAAAFERAVSLYAHEEVLSLGARLLEFDLDLPLGRLAAVNEQMATAATSLLRFEEAQLHAENAMALSRRLGDETGVRRGAALAANVHVVDFKPRQAIDLIEKQLEGLDDLRSDPELARLGGLLSRAKRLDADLDGALTAADRALVAAEDLELHDVVAEVLITKAVCFGFLGRNVEARDLLESVVELAKRKNLTEQAMTAYINQAFLIPADEQSGHDPSLDAIELGRRVGDLSVVLLASGNHAEYLMMRGKWDETEQLLADPLWQSATGRPEVFKLLLQAMSQALQGRIADAQAILRAAFEAIDDEPEDPWGDLDAAAAIVSVLIGDTAAALDWAEGLLEDPKSITFIDLLSQVLLPAGDRRQVEALATASIERGLPVDLRHRRFVRSVVAVRPDDPASLGAAEELIADAASSGLVLDELMWTIGLARWLPDGHADRVRLMARARARIDESGFGGLARFLDP
jgi:tetratricopeptide (TPR) repeat protein